MIVLVRIRPNHPLRQSVPSVGIRIPLSTTIAQMAGSEVGVLAGLLLLQHFEADVLDID